MSILLLDQPEELRKERNYSPPPQGLCCIYSILHCNEKVAIGGKVKGLGMTMYSTIKTLFTKKVGVGESI